MRKLLATIAALATTMHFAQAADWPLAPSCPSKFRAYDGVVLAQANMGLHFSAPGGANLGGAPAMMVTAPPPMAAPMTPHGAGQFSIGGGVPGGDRGGSDAAQSKSSRNRKPLGVQ